MTKIAFAVLALLLPILTLQARQSEPPVNYRNPIISGFNPDPSICRVGDDYYLVTSSFEWYPGMPIYHSCDLVNWELIGYGISDPKKISLDEGLLDSQGIYAATIHYHDGLFYIITTVVGSSGNFYVTATDPRGEWSEPIWLDSPGIDPSLFWDDDGKCYYIGNANLNQVQQWEFQQGVFMQELDLDQKKLVGPRRQITYGHASNAIWTESPHLYKIDGGYLLMVAEGGTEYRHAVTQFHSDSIWGPYIPSQYNPVLTHRHLGNDFPVSAVGHADIVETQNGEWWMVHLAKRHSKDGYCHLGRETFLTPVRFEHKDGRPTMVAAPGVGIVPVEERRPNLPWTPVEQRSQIDEFDDDKLALEWNFLRTPKSRWYNLQDGVLSLDLRAEMASEAKNPSLIAQRVKHREFSVSVKLNFRAKLNSEAAGLILYRQTKGYITLLKQGEDIVASEVSQSGEREVARVEAPFGEVELGIVSNGDEVRFYYIDNRSKEVELDGTATLYVISDENGATFNGLMAGVYATSNGKESKSKAKFDRFELEYSTLINN